MNSQKRKKTFSFGDTHPQSEWDEIEKRIENLSQKVLKETKLKAKSHSSRKRLKPFPERGLHSTEKRRVDLFIKSENYVSGLIKIVKKHCSKNINLKKDIESLNMQFISQNVNKIN